METCTLVLFSFERSCGALAQPVSYTHLDVYKRQKQEMWLKPGFKVYDRPLINGAKEKSTPLSPYTKVTVLRTAKTLRDEFVEIEGQGWVNKAFVTEKDNRMEKVQDLLNSKYNSPSVSYTHLDYLK